ncbi:hypothetical protein HDV04_005683 [Boothiomyces sp. JEL0838]|nr:hypothetical protein HDV04_005683 [Boothiomyces sp. JEL0838]
MTSRKHELEFDSYTMSKDKQRKVSHSLTEKIRRERIKDCINQLKDLVPHSSFQNNVQKLNILENTVQYIKSVQQVLKQHNIVMNESTVYVANTVSQGAHSETSSPTLTELVPQSTFVTLKTSVYTPSLDSAGSPKSPNSPGNSPKTMKIENLLS